MVTEVRLHARTDVGRTRDHNEDNFLCDRALGLFIVADGMGGHAAGEVASQIAVHALADAVRRDWDFVEDFARGDGSVRPEDVKNLLGAAVGAANAAVFADAQVNTARRGMGTTVSVLLLAGARAFIAHVGDSRIYLARGGEVRQLTEDHSVINELRRRGRLRPEILEKIQAKNAVTRAVGVFETVEVDSSSFLVAPGDRFVLCSDGLHRYLPDEASLAPLLDGVADEAATRRMIDWANERGGEDNITAVSVTLPDEDRREAVVEALRHSYQTLSALPFFRNLEPRELLQVQAIARVRDEPDGAVVVTEGAAGDAMFVLMAGSCEVRKGELTIARIEPGEHFGEMALVESAPRSASVVADGGARLLEIARGDLFRLLRESKDTGMKLLWNIVAVLAQRLRETSSQLGEAREALRAPDLTHELFADDYPAVLPSAAGSTAPPTAAPATATATATDGDRDTLPSGPSETSVVPPIPRAPALPAIEE